jgi:hypothetical protein
MMPAELGLSDTESLQAQRMKLEMDKIGLPGLSEEQCFGFKDVIAKLTALSEEQLLAFKGKLAKLKSRMPIWRAIQEPPTLKQKQEAISKLRRSLNDIIRFERSSDKADGAIRDILLGADLAPELADTQKDGLVGGHLDVAEWLAHAEKIYALAKQLEEVLHAPVKSSKRWGPVPVPPRARLIGVDLPNLYAKVFARKFSPTRTLDVEFLQTCLALLGEASAKGEHIRDCVKLAGKRNREHSREHASSAI